MNLAEFEMAMDAMCRDHGWEWGLDIDTGTACAWSAELRVTLNPNSPDGPDRSLVTFATGGADPAEVAVRARTAMRGWLRELGLFRRDAGQPVGDGGRVRAEPAGEPGSQAWWATGGGEVQP
jgi:hypothetical protein